MCRIISLPVEPISIAILRTCVYVWPNADIGSRILDYADMPDVKLSITPIQGFPGNYQVVVSGSGFQFAANREVRWKLKGDDSVFDDNIIAPSGSGTVSPDGSFGFTANAISGNLNEDWGKDEIYAVVRIGGTEYKSPNVTGYF